jgi:hypothetical protein
MTDEPKGNVRSLEEARDKRKTTTVLSTCAGDVRELVQVVGEPGSRLVSIDGPKDADGWALTPDQVDEMALDMIRAAQGVRELEKLVKKT